MKYIRPAIIVIFIVVTIIFSVDWYRDKQKTDYTYPEIEIGAEQIDVSVKATREELLKDVVAKDGKDGDLTNDIVIESISKFVDKKKHICNITYAVADSDNNVVKKTRKIRFTDYTSPKFTLSQPLCFDVGTDINPSSVIGAVDDYDGDISNDVKILSSTLTTGMSGEYTITAQVTNSLGDTAKIKADVVVKPRNNLSPVITLKKNIVYLKKGDKFDEEDYVDSVKDATGKKISNASVSVVSSSVDTEKEGCYSVQYAVNSGEINEGSTYLTVVVED